MNDIETFDFDTDGNEPSKVPGGECSPYNFSTSSCSSDLFPTADFQNYMARDKELSTYTNNTIGFKVSYEIDTGWSHDWLEKASVSLAWDMMSLEYENFRDARQTNRTPGTESLYSLDADVIRFFISAWF